MIEVEPIRSLKKIEEIKEILRPKPRNYMIFVLGLNLQLRISDLLSLRIRDLMDSTGKVKDHIRVKESKTGKVIRRRVNDKAREAIAFSLAHEGIRGQGEYVFPGRFSDKHLTREMAWRIIHQAGLAVGLERIATHSARKSWGYHARKGGVGISLIQKVLGHTTPAITMRYIGITDDEISDVQNLIQL